MPAPSFHASPPLDGGGSSRLARVLGCDHASRRVAPSRRPRRALRRHSPTGNGAPLTPLRAQMIRDRPWQRLAPQTPKASVPAVAGVAQCSPGSPERRRPEQRRTSRPHLWTARRRAWSACPQAAAGLTFCSPKPLGGDVRPLDRPPRTGRSPRPQGRSIEARQRLCPRPKQPRHRVLLRPT